MDVNGDMCGWGVPRLGYCAAKSWNWFSRTRGLVGSRSLDRKFMEGEGRRMMLTWLASLIERGINIGKIKRSGYYAK